MKKFSLILIAILVFAPFFLVFAGGIDEVPKLWEDKEDIIRFLHGFLEWIWRILFVVVVIMFLYGAFVFVTADGNAERIEKAKKMIKWGLVGVVVMILAGGVLSLVESFLTQGITG